MVEEEGDDGNKMKRKTKIISVAIAILFLVALFTPLLPMTLLGVGQMFDFIPNTTLYQKSESYLEEKYSKKFKINYLNETSISGTYYGTAKEVENGIMFHLVGFNQYGKIHIQDDYELQTLVDPIINSIFENEKIKYEVEFGYPQMLSGNYNVDKDWGQVVKQRNEKEVELDIYFYRNKSEYDSKEIIKKLIQLRKRIEKENFGILNLVIVYVDTDLINEEYLSKPKEKRLENALYICSFLEDTSQLECKK